MNKLLEKAGWYFFDTENKPANILLEQNVKITQKHFDEFGEDFEKTKNGYTDFTLIDENSFPIAVLEAKSEDKHPLVGKEQARTYAKSLNVRYIILSNGNIHYFWDAAFRKIIDENKFAELETNPVFSMQDLKKLDGWRDDLINYVKDYMNLNMFMGAA